MTEIQTWVLVISVVVTISATIIKIYKDDNKALHDRITKVEGAYVECKYCERQHNDLNENIREIKKQGSQILDAILGRK